MKSKYDVITVGGGLGGSSLALLLARRGYRVLVLEREEQFRDRVRGEGMLPWGVNLARKLGIYPYLAGSCAHVVRYWSSRGWRSRRDLEATTPEASHCLNFYHPEMQEVLLEAAQEAGAEVRRRATVREVIPGRCPAVVAQINGSAEKLEARLVVGADGRSSRVRKWGGFAVNKDPERLVVAGLLLEGGAVPNDSVHILRQSSLGKGALFFPLGGGRVRTYFIYRKQGGRMGLSGPGQVTRFIQCCVEVGAPVEWLENARAGGPLAEFEGADNWVSRPYREGVALVGDAASSNDPSWGNGLSLTLQDVSALTQRLLSHDDWEQAGRVYGEDHQRHFGVMRTVTRWLTDLMYETGAEAEAARARAFPLLREDKSRSLDYIAYGPETPHDEQARRRLFGEEATEGARANS